MSNEQAVEKEIQEKGLTAPRVTPAEVDAAISSEHYFVAGEAVRAANIARGNVDFDGQPPAMPRPLALLTFCVLVLRNGFTVTGESACASPENFDADLGRKIAKDNARAKIWPLMGYALRDKLAEGRIPG